MVECDRQARNRLDVVVLDRGPRLNANALPITVIVRQQGEQQMIAPRAVDAQIGAGIAFLAEPQFAQQALARHIGWQTGRLETMEPDN